MRADADTPIIETSLQDGPVQVALWEGVSSAGAEAVFVGRTRPETHSTHGPLQHLDYLAYAPMVEAELQQLAERVARRHHLIALRAVHALGPVGVGEASVVVQCLAGHRDAAFAACRETIDTLKARLPIWKREVWADGATFQDGVAVTPEPASRNHPSGACA